jgi:hypothetical protein
MIKEVPLKSICKTFSNSGAFKGCAVDGVLNKSRITTIDGTPMGRLM